MIKTISKKNLAFLLLTVQISTLRANDDLRAIKACSDTIFTILEKACSVNDKIDNFNCDSGGSIDPSIGSKIDLLIVNDASQTDCLSMIKAAVTTVSGINSTIINDAFPTVENQNNHLSANDSVAISTINDIKSVQTYSVISQLDQNASVIECLATNASFNDEIQSSFLDLFKESISDYTVDLLSFIDILGSVSGVFQASLFEADVFFNDSTVPCLSEVFSNNASENDQIDEILGSSIAMITDILDNQALLVSGSTIDIQQCSDISRLESSTESLGSCIGQIKEFNSESLLSSILPALANIASTQQSQIDVINNTISFNDILIQSLIDNLIM